MRISLSSAKTGWFLLVAGFILLGIVSFHFYDNFEFLRRAVRGYGKINSLVKIQDGRTTKTLWVQVQFKAEDSKIYTVVLPNEIFRPFRGNPVTFLYNPDNPQDARSLQVSYQYPWSEILLVLACLIPVYSGFRILLKARAVDQFAGIPRI
jgi:hypothetical protein